MRPMQGTDTTESARYPVRMCQTLAQVMCRAEPWPSIVAESTELPNEMEVDTHGNDEQVDGAGSQANENQDANDENEAVIEENQAPENAEAGENDGLSQKERREIDAWLLKVHRQLGHRNNRVLVRLLQRRGTHPAVLRRARHTHCSPCHETQAPTMRHVSASYEAVPGAILEIDGMHWQHPVTLKHARCQFMVDVASRAPMVTVFEETRERNHRNNTTVEVKESLLKDWMVHRG